MAQEMCSIVDNIVRSKLPMEEVPKVTIGEWIHKTPNDPNEICFVSFNLFQECFFENLLIL